MRLFHAAEKFGLILCLSLSYSTTLFAVKAVAAGECIAQNDGGHCVARSNSSSCSGWDQRISELSKQAKNHEANFKSTHTALQHCCNPNSGQQKQCLMRKSEGIKNRVFKMAPLVQGLTQVALQPGQGLNKKCLALGRVTYLQQDLSQMARSTCHNLFNQCKRHYDKLMPTLNQIEGLAKECQLPSKDTWKSYIEEINNMLKQCAETFQLSQFTFFGSQQQGLQLGQLAQLCQRHTGNKGALGNLPNLPQQPLDYQVKTKPGTKLTTGASEGVAPPLTPPTPMGDENPAEGNLKSAALPSGKPQLGGAGAAPRSGGGGFGGAGGGGAGAPKKPTSAAGVPTSGPKKSILQGFNKAGGYSTQRLGKGAAGTGGLGGGAARFGGRGLASVATTAKALDRQIAAQSSSLWENVRLRFLSLCQNEQRYCNAP